MPWIPPPQPAIQDEFSNLLAADTFASGRLADPPHPLWVFFESVHISQVGILLSMAVLCGPVAWALQNWLPPLWAFLGTVIGVLKIGMLRYWRP